jgi:translocation and assembly module TamA
MTSDTFSFSASPALSIAALVLALLLPIAPLPLHAQTLTGYGVAINGAGPLKPLLDDYLDVVRRADESIARDELERLVAAAPAQIRQLLATEGYFAPRIEPLLVQEGGRWVARINIDPGPVTRIDRVDLRFAGALAQGPQADPRRIDNLRRQWSLTPGEVFRQEEWNKAKGDLLKGLLVRDYPAARIADSSARIDPQKHAAALAVEVDSGPLFTFGELQVQGLQRYSRERIDALNPIKPGEPFSQEKLTELQTRLQDSGYFNTVFATIEVDPDHPDAVPVRVDLTENKRFELATGVGFSTDKGAHVQAKWLDRRFMGREWRLDSELRLDRTTRLLGADLLFPARDSGWRPSVGAHYERTDIEGELNDKIRLDGRMTGPRRNNEETWGIAYLAEHQRIRDGESRNRQALVGTYAYVRRHVDNLLAPTRGYVASIELAAGPRGPINQANIGRVLLRANWLSPTWHKLQAVARAEIGQVVGAGRTDVPSDLLFRAGGDRSVRGYAYNSLGVTEGSAIVGGRVLGTVSAELVYYFRPAWGVALFHDAGNAADRWSDFRLEQGSGIGARWKSPIGAVNVDLAYAHATHKPRLHFSIGYGF